MEIAPWPAVILLVLALLIGVVVVIATPRRGIEELRNEIEDLKLVNKGLWGKIQMLQKQRTDPYSDEPKKFAPLPCRCQKVGRMIACGKQFLREHEFCQKDKNPEYWNMERR